MLAVVWDLIYQPEHQHVASPCGLSVVRAILGLLIAWWLGSRGESPKRARWKGRCFHDLVLEFAKGHFYLLCWPRQLQRTMQVQKEEPIGGTTPWEECQGHIARRACIMREIVVAIFGKNPFATVWVVVVVIQDRV